MTDSGLNDAVTAMLSLLWPEMCRLKAKFPCYHWDDVESIFDDAIMKFIEVIGNAGRDPVVAIWDLVSGGKGRSETYYGWLNCLNAVNRSFYLQKKRLLGREKQCAGGIDKPYCVDEEKLRHDARIELLLTICTEMDCSTEENRKRKAFALHLIYEGDHDELRKMAGHDPSSKRRRVSQEKMRKRLRWGRKKWDNEKLRLYDYFAEQFAKRQGVEHTRAFRTALPIHSNGGSHARESLREQELGGGSDTNGNLPR